MRTFAMIAALASVLGPLRTTAADTTTTFFGTAKVKPTFYGNFDFDSNREDTPALNEGGWAAGEHVRTELRLGWLASGDKWKVKLIAEVDLIMEKDTADRSFYTSPAKDGLPNAGSEFGIERAELTYAFAPSLELETGWDLRAMDIRSGGLVFGDDHPFIGFRGRIGKTVGYEALYLAIENREPVGVSQPARLGDWRAYSLKVDLDVPISGNKLTVSPFVLASDNQDKFARAYYYGAELSGRVAFLKPSVEFAYVTGEFRDTGRDIRSWAAFAGTEVVLTRAFNPYVAVRYARGDDDLNDGDVEGFVGITDIGRFTPLLGMDGNILGEHLSSGASIYGSPLYSYSPDRAVGGNVYGGIGNASSGNNPGQRLAALGANGDLAAVLPKLSYKAQALFIWYDRTGNLNNVRAPGDAVASYAGTVIDAQLKYAFSKAFAVDYIFSTFLPGAGIEDQVNASDLALVHALTLAWTY